MFWNKIQEAEHEFARFWLKDNPVIVGATATPNNIFYLYSSTKKFQEIWKIAITVILIYNICFLDIYTDMLIYCGFFFSLKYFLPASCWFCSRVF